MDPTPRATSIGVNIYAGDATKLFPDADHAALPGEEWGLRCGIRAQDEYGLNKVVPRAIPGSLQSQGASGSLRVREIASRQRARALRRRSSASLGWNGVGACAVAIASAGSFQYPTARPAR
jgi:hypothetical protein